MGAPGAANGRVAAIVVNYNAGPGLIGCLYSALEQCDAVVLVDNASTDGSLQRVRDAWPESARLSILPQSSNLGFAAACNIGARSVSADWLLFLNPDCELQPQAVANLVRAAEADPTVGIAGGLLLNPDGTEQAGGRCRVPTPWRSFTRAFGLKSLARRWPTLFAGYDLNSTPVPAAATFVDMISGACMLVRRAATLEVGLFDERYFLYCEDHDLCMRFLEAGWRILFVPDAKIVHQRGVCGRSRPLFIEWHKHKGMVRFYRTHFRRRYPAALMWLVVSGISLRYALLLARHGGARLMHGGYFPATTKPSS
jgi:GT2 family glycosyltransferase